MKKSKAIRMAGVSLSYKFRTGMRLDIRRIGRVAIGLQNAS